MTIARRPSPFGELLSLRTAMDRLFEDSFVRPMAWAGAGSATQFPRGSHDAPVEPTGDEA
jgi:hypothetical protein